uniref:Potassium channel domain-containing protein n=1 Tax=Ananas comosus var. bracteatus TaxID=296719 RepID=A0A6V7PV78_ANACO|nr:unnamed protein product [Ananas comosus var. bracteatus]
MGDNKKPLLSSTPPPPPPPLLLLLRRRRRQLLRRRRRRRRQRRRHLAAAADAALSTVAAVLIGGAIIAFAVIIYLAIGVIGFSRPSALYVKTPTSPTVDALYFSVSTLATVGYGDAHPGTSLFKVLSVPFTLLGYALLNLLVAVTVPAAAKLLAVLRRRYRVLIAAAAILLPVAAGALVFHFVETQGWVDSVYMSVISVTTVGYGDEVFKTRPGRAFASVWLLIGMLSVTHSFNFLVDKLLDWWTPRTNFVTRKGNRRKNYTVLVEMRLAALGQMESLGDE